MQQHDFDEFRRMLESLSRLFAPLKELPTDELVQTYWRALRDLSIEVVRNCARKVERTGKFFPKPSELRPKEEKRSDESAAQRASIEYAVKFNAETWRRFSAADPARAKWALLDAYLGRIDAQYRRDDPAYESKREWARGIAEQLRQASTPEIFGTNLHARHVAIEFWPQLLLTSAPQHVPSQKALAQNMSL